MQAEIIRLNSHSLLPSKTQAQTDKLKIGISVV